MFQKEKKAEYHSTSSLPPVCAEYRVPCLGEQGLRYLNKLTFYKAVLTQLWGTVNYGGLKERD